jgi:serine phosphatase RsbU (regulator of sigma subunit)
MELQFSGAFNPIFIISNNNLEVLRGDRIPIGYSMKNDVYFSRHHFKLNKGDIIYLLSDGYCDQLGGESRKKFMTKRFSHLLLDIYQFPLEKQMEWLDKTFSEWKGDNDQVDDVTVIGVKL